MFLHHAGRSLKNDANVWGRLIVRGQDFLVEEIVGSWRRVEGKDRIIMNDAERISPSCVSRITDGVGNPHTADGAIGFAGREVYGDLECGSTSEHIPDIVDRCPTASIPDGENTRAREGRAEIHRFNIHKWPTGDWGRADDD